MKELKLKLNHNYKSFETLFSTSISGDLVILSGVNGSGKSQILNIIYGQEGKDFRKKIQSEVSLDDQLVKTTQIDIRSFKDNTFIPELTPSTSQSFINSTSQAWYAYTRDRLNIGAEQNFQFIESCIIARKILIDFFGNDIYESGKIREDEFKSKLLEKDFIWREGDKFTNSIGEIFFNHALKVSEIMKNVGRSNYRYSMLEKAPWVILNELFERLKFEYRFKKDYLILGVEMNEQPKLFPLDINNNINVNEGRILADLSDGEKTIISLCFASLIGNKFSEKKLLLLDELDSVLNPSLVEMFFAVIDEFFIKKGIMVIMATHSSSTISLSPSYTKFYEVFKPNQSGVRLLEVSKEQYSELLVANKNFYERISNQVDRIKELEKIINSNVEILIVTEGKTDWKYLISALKYFHSKDKFLELKECYFYRFGSRKDLDLEICGTTHVNELSDSKLKNYLNSLKNSREIDNSNSKVRIGVFDSDTNIALVNDEQKNIYSLKIEPDGISTEFLFSDDEIKNNINGKRLFIGDEFDSRTKKHKIENYNLGGDSNNLNKAGKRTIIETDVYNNESFNIAIPKEIFANAIYNGEITVSEESWEKFEHIFIFISSIINKQKL